VRRNGNKKKRLLATIVVQGQHIAQFRKRRGEQLNPIARLLQQQGFVMLDGGLATEMERHGADLDDQLWSAKMLAEAPELIRRVHADFLSAGADVIATATYQASFDGFARKGIDEVRAEGLMRLGVDLAVLARETFWSDRRNHASRQRPLVAASVGPYGASLHDGSEYHGNYDIGVRELADFHRPRLELLVDTDADLLAFETIPSQMEAELLLELLQAYPDKRAWLSFSCRDGENVCHGERFAECAALADQSEQIVAVGINCTAPRHITSLLEQAASIGTPLAVYPNSGETWVAQRQEWDGARSSRFPVAEWYDSGARLVGGCCRTTSGDIKEMRSILREHVN
jgi:homocysteine S-methyltransferase